MTHPLDLLGLREDMARDFLATIGLLRLIDLKWPSLQAKLSWEINQGFPRIHLNSQLPPDWCQQLVADIQSLEQHPESPLFHGEIIKTEYQIYRAAILKTLNFQSEVHPLASLPAFMFAAYAGQSADPKTGMIEPSMLSFANGQSGKSLLRDVRELIRIWDADALSAALNGTGVPLPGKSFRWSPREYRPAAHRAHDPGSKLKGDEPMDHPSFNLLAFFGVSCVPSLSNGEGCDTACFSRDESGWSFRWPVWSQPLSVSEVTALLTTPAHLIVTIPDITRVWKSRRLVAEKSVYFAPATLA
jgi:hypothetical protein